MLAGKIRLKTFLIGLAALLGLGTCGVVAVPIAAVALLGEDLHTPPPSPNLPAVEATAPRAPATAAPLTATAPASAAPTSSGAATGRAADDAVFRYLGKPLGSDKKKDVTSGQPYKVNVYQDAGQSVANRAKLDLDRDEKWDEKFTWKNDTIERQVAPADDESYTETYVWTGTAWARK